MDARRSGGGLGAAELVADGEDAGIGGERRRSEAEDGVVVVVDVLPGSCLLA